MLLNPYLIVNMQIQIQLLLSVHRQTQACRHKAFCSSKVVVDTGDCVVYRSLRLKESSGPLKVE